MDVWKFAAAAALATGLGTSAQAATIFDSTLLSNMGEFSGSSFGQSFFSPAGSSVVGSVSLLLSSPDVGSGSILVYIAPDDGGGFPDLPGASQIGSILDTDFASANTPELMTLSTSFVLSPSSQYWVVIDPVGSSISWLAGEAGTGPSVGVTDTSAFDGTDVYPVSDFNFVFQMKIDTQEAPEPVSLTLFGTGLLGLGLASRLRRRKSA